MHWIETFYLLNAIHEPKTVITPTAFLFVIRKWKLKQQIRRYMLRINGVSHNSSHDRLKKYTALKSQNKTLVSSARFGSKRLTNDVDSRSILLSTSIVHFKPWNILRTFQNHLGFRTAHLDQSCTLNYFMLYTWRQFQYFFFILKYLFFYFEWYYNSF